MNTSQPSAGFVTIQNLHNALDALVVAQLNQAKYQNALDDIRKMVTDESGHNMQKVGCIANEALEGIDTFTIKDLIMAQAKAEHLRDAALAERDEWKRKFEAVNKA